MKVGCARCNKEFESLVIAPETAWKDIFIDLHKHVVKQHPKFNKKLLESAAKAQMSIFSYLVITESTRATEDNGWLNKRIEELRDVIMRMIGYEPIDDEEEETEEIEEEKEDTKEEEESPVFEDKAN